MTATTPGPKTSEYKLSTLSSTVMMVAGLYLILTGNIPAGTALLGASGIPIGGYAISRGMAKHQ